MEVRIATEPELWNDFLKSQPGGHLLQSYEWGELIQHQGRRIYRLGP
jgi:peptidoglycan pentaglycine glycine transferase (the first glycine)